MQTLSPIEKIDQVLNYLKINDSGASDKLSEFLKDKTIQKYEFQQILVKLEKDGYANFIKSFDTGFYRISFEGSLFKGYRVLGRANLLKQRLFLIREWSLALGTVLAGMYGLFEILKWLFHHFHWHLFF